MKTLILIIVSLFSFNGFAQIKLDPSAEANFVKYKKMRKAMGPNVQLTPVAGFNGVSYQDDTVTVAGQKQTFSSEAESGSSIGLLLDYNTGFYGIGLQTGLVLNRYFSKFTLVNNIQKISFEYEDAYLTLPMNLKIYPFSRAGQWFYLKGGMNLSYLMDSKEHVTEGPINSAAVSQRSADNTALKKEFDVQAVAGAGINIRLSSILGLNIEGNYLHGLVDTKLQHGANDPEFKTQGYMGLIGLSFYL